MLHGGQGTQMQYCAVRHHQRIEISRHAGGSQSTLLRPAFWKTWRLPARALWPQADGLAAPGSARILE